MERRPNPYAAQQTVQPLPCHDEEVKKNIIVKQYLYDSDPDFPIFVVHATDRYTRCSRGRIVYVTTLATMRICLGIYIFGHVRVAGVIVASVRACIYATGVFVFAKPLIAQSKA